ncbi:unnamed protein product, partial [marine sediment metagenome]
DSFIYFYAVRYNHYTLRIGAIVLFEPLSNIL